MANDLTANPWIFDTVGEATGYKGGNVKVRHFEYSDYTAETDGVVVVDRNGRVVWTNNGASDLQEVRSGNIGWVKNGLYVSTLSSGKLKVYIE